MSLKGNAESYVELRGSLSIPDMITGKSAYEVAVLNGFHGTEAEWLDSLDFDGGINCVTECRGYYYRTVNLAEKYIRLAHEQTVPRISQQTGLSTDKDFPAPPYEKGDLIAIVNNNKYFSPTAKIRKIDHDFIYYEGDLGFTEINAVTSLDIDDYSVYVKEKPHIGEHILKYGAFASGIRNAAIGNGAASFGGGNLTYGDWGLTYGTGNRAAWAASCGGYDNKGDGFYSDTTGRDNVNEAECGRMSGRGNKATKDAYGADVSGQYNTAKAENVRIGGRWNTANAGATNADISGNSNTVDAPHAHVTGNSNTVGSKATSADVSGQSNNVNSANVHVSGTNNKVSDGIQVNKGSSVGGNNNTLTGANNANLHGQNNKIIGSDAYNKYGGSQSDVGGLDNTLDGTSDGSNATNVHLHGEKNWAGHRTVDVGGCGNRSSARYQTIRGTYNEDDPNALLIVGNGTGASRSNAFVVRKNGSIVAGKHYVDTQDVELLQSSLDYNAIGTGDEYAWGKLVTGTWGYRNASSYFDAGMTRDEILAKASKATDFAIHTRVICVEQDEFGVRETEVGIVLEGTVSRVYWQDEYSDILLFDGTIAYNIPSEIGFLRGCANPYTVSLRVISEERMNTEANGDFSVALGYGVVADGENSSVFGVGTRAQFPGETVMGRFNKVYSASDVASMVKNNYYPIFVIGSGANDLERNDAFEVWSNGVVKIGGRLIKSDALV